MPAELWRLSRGDAPLIVNVPHAGTYLPAEIARGFTPAALRLPDTDWHVDALYDFVIPLGATLMSATHSRYVADLNRDPGGAVLYPGASNTEICPTATFHDEPLYREGQAPDLPEIEARIEHYWKPYHAQLAGEVERIRVRHGYCILLDGHSIVSEAPRFFAGRLPDLNLGTADGASAAPDLTDGAFALLAGAHGFSAILNGRFKGGYIIRHYGRPQHGVHALQLEMAQACYMNEIQPGEFDRVRAAPLRHVLRALVDRLLAWKPALPSRRANPYT